MSNASKSFTSMQATRSHRRDVNGMVGQWSTFNQMRTFLREICVPLQPADPLKSTASAALQKGLMFQPHSESLVVETSNHAVWWTSCLANRSHKGTQKSLGNHRTIYKENSRKFGTWWHGSVGRAHRSHRWGHWFESNCHHHSEALVDQGLPLFCPSASQPRGLLFSRFTLAT